LALIYVGCNESDFLNEDDPTRITEADFWQDEADVESAMATVYSALRGQLKGYWGAYRGFGDINAMGDDVFTITGESASQWAIASFTNDENNNDTEALFTFFYYAIHRSNLLLDRIVDVPMDESKKNSYIAEAKFLRGFTYYLLASNWGSVPIRTEPVETTDGYSLERSPVAEVWEQAISDLSEAKAGLPVERPDEEQGRATSGIAIALIGKSYLFMEDYDKAEAELALLMESPYSYDLVDDYEDNFTDENEYNQESVFEWTYAAFGTKTYAWREETATSPMYNYIPQFVGPVGSGGWFKYVPSNFLVEEFLKEERPEGSDTKFDKRMYTTFFWEYSEFGENDTTWYGGSDFDFLWNSSLSKTLRLYPETPLDTITNGRFLFRKFTSSWRNIPKSDNYWSATPSTANHRIVRFAEILLMHAEAALQNNNTDVAIASINRIRVRAGLTEKTAADLPSKDAVMDELKHQKLLELVFEQNRIYDLRRWYPNESALKQIFTERDKQGANTFTAKHYVFPIPASELETNPSITQNELW
jgi:hypothetical protein